MILPFVTGPIMLSRVAASCQLAAIFSNWLGIGLLTVIFIAGKAAGDEFGKSGGLIEVDTKFREAHS
jgi:hypothetical protein